MVVWTNYSYTQTGRFLMSDLDLYSLWDQVMQKTKTKMPQQMWDSLVVNSLMPYSMTSTTLTLFVMDPSKLKYIQTPLVHNQILEAAKSLLPTLQTIDYLTDMSTSDTSVVNTSMINTVSFSCHHSKKCIHSTRYPKACTYRFIFY